MQLFIHKYTCNTCQALLNACQALIDQSIGHFGINYTSVRHMGLDILGLDILGTTRALLLVGVVRAMYRCDKV